MTDPEIKCAACDWKQLRPYVFRTDDGKNYWCSLACRKAIRDGLIEDSVKEKA